MQTKTLPNGYYLLNADRVHRRQDGRWFYWHAGRWQSSNLRDNLYRDAPYLGPLNGTDGFDQ